MTSFFGKRTFLLFTAAFLLVAAGLGHGGHAMAEPRGFQVRLDPPEDEDADATSVTKQKKQDSKASSKKAGKDSPAKAGSSKKSDKKGAASKPAEEKKATNQPQVEIYIPSITDLVQKSKESNTGQLVKSFSSLMPKMEQESEDDFDFSAVIGIFKQIAEWPDTSAIVTIYTQDRDGRPRWALQLDWSVEELHKRVQALLDLEAAKKIVEDISLRPHEKGSFKLESPDTVLAVLRRQGKGSVIASTDDLALPESVFGQKTRGKAGKANSLVYCRLNMEAGDEEEKAASVLAGLSFISDVRYAASVTDDGRWKERFNIRWNVLIGLGAKQALKKTTSSFNCPRDSYVNAAFHLALGEGLADSIAGLPEPAIGGRAGGDVAFTAVTGNGFFPIPDIYYQFNARRIDKIKKEIRTVLRKDARKRAEEDKPPAWHEEKVGKRTIFWHDPAADQVGGYFSLATFRTVIFFEEADEEDEDGASHLIIGQTSTRADDAVRRWEANRGKSSKEISMPTTQTAHWQVVVNWKKIYELIQPYLSILAGSAEDAAPLPSPAEVRKKLCDSVVNIRIEYAGLDIRHEGPLPAGAAFVPGVAVGALWSTAAPTSEAQRERLACQNLRVLYHHAKLFKKDYGRWPATVAELDGYVDFASHPNLLYITPRNEGFLKGFVTVFTGDKRKKQLDEQEEKDVDDSLYEIDWSEESWQLKFRDDEFAKYKTICINDEGEIIRVSKDDPKPDSKSRKKSDKKELALQ